MAGYFISWLSLAHHRAIYTDTRHMVIIMTGGSGSLSRLRQCVGACGESIREGVVLRDGKIIVPNRKGAVVIIGGGG